MHPILTLILTALSVLALDTQQTASAQTRNSLQAMFQDQKPVYTTHGVMCYRERLPTEEKLGIVIVSRTGSCTSVPLSEIVRAYTDKYFEAWDPVLLLRMPPPSSAWIATQKNP